MPRIKLKSISLSKTEGLDVIGNQEQVNLKSLLIHKRWKNQRSSHKFARYWPVCYRYNKRFIRKRINISIMIQLIRLMH